MRFVLRLFRARGRRGSVSPSRAHLHPQEAPRGLPLGRKHLPAYTWRDIDALTAIGDGANSIASYTWVGVRKKGTTHESGATRANVYTGFRSELQTVLHQTSSQATIVQLDYAYNKVRDKLYERFGGAGSSGDAFEYDKLRRLTRAWMGSTDPTNPSANPYVRKIDYNYDDDGNRTSVVTTPYQQTPASTGYTTNSLNEYTAVGGTSWTHDKNGNLTDDGTFSFNYDYKNLSGSGTVKATCLTLRVNKAVG